MYIGKHRPHTINDLNIVEIVDTSSSDIQQILHI